MWRKRRDALFRSHSQSPVPTNAVFNNLAYFPYADVEVGAGESITWPAGEDGTATGQAFARTSGLAAQLGGELTLYWLGGYGGGLFLPFHVWRWPLSDRWNQGR